MGRRPASSRKSSPVMQMNLLARLGLAGLALGAVGSLEPAMAIELAPHRAIYDLSLARSSQSSEIANVTGTMTFEWGDACDGWTVNQRSLMSFAYRSGEELELAWSLVSWEAKDGLRYRFFVRKAENGESKTEFRGEARLDGVGKGGVAEYRIPAARQVTLPAGTLFPTAHTVKVLEASQAGQRLVWAHVFDGSDEDGLFGVSAVLGAVRTSDADARWPLLAGPSRHVGLAFFASSGQAAAPEHEQSLRLYDNGVVDALVLDYGDFRVSAKLRDLEKASPPPC